MKAVGIICEYNPFHLGHQWHLSEAKRLTGADAAVCVMSGAFVQRGEPALFEEYARAETAVRCGADLVLALPVPWAMASAQRFALGGVAILDGLGVCSHLSFGSECGDTALLTDVAEMLMRPETDAALRETLSAGMSYAAARQSALEKLGVSGSSCLREPNDTLGIEYISALRKLKSSIKPCAVRRIGRHDGGGEDIGFASASHIRSVILSGGNLAGLVPRETEEILQRESASGRGPVTAGALENMMLYRLRTMTDEEYAALPDGSEGLWMRLARYGRSEASVEAVLEQTKTKRYAMARLRRMVLAAFLGVTAEMQEKLPPYTRVLAMNGTGAALLKTAKQRAKLPVITKTADAKAFSGFAGEILSLEARAADLRALAYTDESARRSGAFWKTSPKFVEK